MGHRPTAGDEHQAPFDVRLLTPAERRRAREGRLAALSDTPEAFLPATPPESTWGADGWRRSFRSGLWAVAGASGRVIGIARLTRDGVGPHLESIWTHPRHRRRGVASQLVRLLVGAARRGRRRDVLVWVIPPNPAAERLYLSLGFVPTGEQQAVDGDGRIETRLLLPATTPL